MSFRDLRLYHGPVGVLPMMQEARVGVWHTGGIVPTTVTVASDAERRQRRLEMYRQRHEANVRSYDVWTSAMADAQRQQTALLFQRWLDSRCKRTTVSKSKVTKGEADDANTKSIIPKTKRRHTDGVASVCHDEHLKSNDVLEDDNSSQTSVSKQRKIAENTDSLFTNVHVLDVVSADMSALLSVPKAGAVGKHEAVGSEVVNSDVDFGGFDDDLSSFYDILKSINGSEFTSEFQKYLNESERDSCNINFSSGDLMCLPVSDVHDAVAEKLTTPQHSTDENVLSQHGTSENVPSLQTGAMFFLSGESKHVEVQSCTQTLPVDNYCTQLWSENLQVHEPVTPWQQMQTSLPTQTNNYSALLKYEAVPMKQHLTVRRQLQAHDANSMPRIQALQQQQQRPQRNQIQERCMTHVSAKPLLAQQTWTQQDWQTSAPWMQQTQQQLLSCQSMGMCSPVVKKEMPLSEIVSSVADAAVRIPQQIHDNTGRGLLPHAYAVAYANMADAAPADHSQVSIYASCQPGVLDCNLSQHPPPGLLMNPNQKGGYVNYSQVVIPEFGSSLNFVPHGATGPLFWNASETNLVRVVADGVVSACPALSSDVLVSAHQLIENENIPTNPESTGR